MKTYSRAEITAAEKAAPEAIRDFLASPALSAIYRGLQQKHGLNLRQIAVIGEMTLTTLLGLEKESAFETNMHQLLPELSNLAAREIISDVNDRIFKEARRRVTEAIPDTEAWTKERALLFDTPEMLTKHKKYLDLDSLPDDDPALEALYSADEQKRREEKRALDEAERKLLEEEAKRPPQPEDEEENEEDDAIREKLGLPTAAEENDITLEPVALPQLVTPPTPAEPPKSIALQKLSAPSTAAPVVKEVPLTTPPKSVAPVTPPPQKTTTPVATPAPVAPVAPATPKKIAIDPYRETPL